MFEILKVEELPRPIRGRTSGVRQMEEWLKLTAALSKGLKPFEEGIKITFPISDKRGLKTINQTFKRAVVEYLRDTHLNEYEVVSITDKMAGKHYIVIRNSPPITGLKSVPKKRSSAQ